MVKPDTPLQAFGRVLADDMAAAEAKRGRGARFEALATAHRTAWRESFGYKLGPIMDRHMVKREAREMVRIALEARLLMMFTPMLVMAESIERSLVIVSILASPSGNGPERYAPKPGGPERISVR